VLDAADGYLPSPVFSGKSGDMFFHSGIRGIFGLYGHWLPAAHHISAAGGKNLDYVSANSALVNCQFFCHSFSSNSGYCCVTWLLFSSVFQAGISLPAIPPEKSKYRFCFNR
jgi:hypothetical protein